jgi:hypothetical protein
MGIVYPQRAEANRPKVRSYGGGPDWAFGDVFGRLREQSSVRHS